VLDPEPGDHSPSELRVVEGTAGDPLGHCLADQAITQPGQVSTEEEFQTPA
jgi:hypothetical protein